jgi:hypothetical protein
VKDKKANVILTRGTLISHVGVPKEHMANYEVFLCDGKGSRPDRSKVLCADEGGEGGGITIENLMKVEGESDKSKGAASRDRLVRVTVECKDDSFTDING